MRRTKAVPALLILAASLFAASPAVADLHVVTTLPEIGLLAREIGGDRVKVESIVSGDENPHYAAAKPSHSRRMHDADLLIYDGLQLEVGYLPLLIRAARNPRIQAGGRGNVDLSRAVQPIEVPTGGVDRSAGDIHPEGNPHYTLDPALYPDLAATVADALGTADPDGAAGYDERLAEFRSAWSVRLEDWRKRLSFLRGAKLIAYHKQWEYLARTLGIDVIGYIEDRPGVPPTARHVADLQALIPVEGVRAVIYSDLVNRKSPETLARRGGCPALALPQAPGSRPGTESLEDWFESLVRALESLRTEGE